MFSIVELYHRMAGKDRDSAPATTDDVYTVPTDYPAIIRAGSDYADLVARPGWKRLLDDLEREADKALASLRDSISSDPVVIKALRDRWVATEAVLKFVQLRASSAIADRKSAMAEVAANIGEDAASDELVEAGVDMDVVDADLFSHDRDEMEEFLNNTLREG